VLAAPSIAILLGPNLAIAAAAVVAAQAALAALDSLTGGSLSATYDPTNTALAVFSFPWILSTFCLSDMKLVSY